MIFIIRVVSMNPNTRKLICKRDEVIDTLKNDLFASCNSHSQLAPLLIERIYETFWNIPTSNEVVKVISVEEVREQLQYGD